MATELWYVPLETTPYSPRVSTGDSVSFYCYSNPSASSIVLTASSQQPRLRGEFLLQLPHFPPTLSSYRYDRIPSQRIEWHRFPP